MDVRQIEELLPFYALDALTEEERGLVEAYLTEHPEARQQLEQMSRAASALPHSAAPVEPPSRVKAGLMSRIAAEAEASRRSAAQSRSSRRTPRFEGFLRTFGLAATALALIWVIVLSVQVSRLRSELSTLNERLAAQSASLEKIVKNLPQTSPSNVITVSLKGTTVEPQAQGQLLVNPNSQSAVLVIAQLPPLEPGQTYQVWLIDGGAPVSAGLLTVDENGQGVLVVTSKEAIGSFNSIAISVEPEGGSPQPTGEIVVKSDL